MNKSLILFLLRKPGSWLACAQVVLAMVRKCQYVTVRRQGMYIRTRIGNGEGLFCAVSGTDYEPEMRWFLGQMNAGDIFVDVGANVGIYSLHASRIIGSRGKILAFEPTPETFEILEKNVRQNSLANIECHRLALAASNGPVSLLSGDRPASNRVVEKSPHPGNGVEIIATKLDDFCSANAVGKICFIKADIEGGENALFLGGRETLLRDKPMILFESMHTGPDFPERETLRRIGYKLFAFEPQGLAELPEKSSWCGNIVAQAF